VSDPLTILHLTHEGHGAGSSISIALLARAQRRAGHRVLVGCPADSWLERVLAPRGVEFVPISFQSISAASYLIEKVAVLGHVDVVNAHSSRDRAATRRLRLRRGLKAALVMTRRGMPMSTVVSAITNGFVADRMIAVSRPVRRALIMRGTPPWRVAVVPNAVDLERVDRVVTVAQRDEARVLLREAALRGPAERGRPAAPGELVIGVVARRKDHDTLVESLRYVKTPVTLCLIGFSTIVYRLPSGVPHRLVSLPFQDDPRPFYDLIDIVTLPTRHEGLSQGLMEAMALGKPIVTTRSGGNTDLIDNGVHGLLVPPRDPRALGAALQRLIDDPVLRERLGAAASQRVRADFTIERTLAGTDAVYRAALAR
jgi:glycosyltransferase involved in cell wall biosynthesis